MNSFRLFLMYRLLILFLLFSPKTFGQDGSNPGIKFSGYVEAYYSYDFNQPEDNLRPDFLYNFNRHNEFSVNLALIKASYETENIRANLALMGGTYAQYNLANEPSWAQILNEVSVGFKLHEKLWFDIGIMPSHLGFESWYGIDCWHLSRSIMADNSPYFLTGARFSYEVSEKIDIQFWLANGWQNVQRTTGSQSIALGLGIDHRPTENLLIHYANYFGNESPQPIKLYRFFNNFYTQYIQNLWGITLGADYGIQQSFIGDPFQWYGVTASLRRQFGEKIFLAGRAEYYSDPNGVILNEGLKVSGLSANLDYNFADNAMFRLEARQFISPEADFSLPGGKFSQGNTAVTGSFAVRF
jgi:hypothetical protein